MSLELYCVLVILICLALCWKWYDDEDVDEGPGAVTKQDSAQKATEPSHRKGAVGSIEKKFDN